MSIITFPNKRMSFIELILLITCLIVLIMFFVLEMKASCLLTKYPVISSILVGIATGIISAITLLYFQEEHYSRRLNRYYSYFEGKYARKDFGQDNTGENELINMRTQNLNLSIDLEHKKGTHTFKFSAEYWKNVNALAEGTIEFSDKNGTLADGRYEYTRADDQTLGNLGIYKIYKLEGNKTRFIVLYQHVFPRKLDNNPDDNRGWEIWEKM